MPEVAPITPADVRAFANLATEVPEALLSEHILVAMRAIVDATGVTVPPDGKAEHWAEALKVRALASVFPWLNTFALDGASKVGTLVGQVEYRFLDTDDVDAKVDGLLTRFDELAATIRLAAEAQNDDAAGSATVGQYTMTAV